MNISRGSSNGISRNSRGIGRGIVYDDCEVGEEDVESVEDEKEYEKKTTYLKRKTDLVERSYNLYPFLPIGEPMNKQATALG